MEIRECVSQLKETVEALKDELEAVKQENKQLKKKVKKQEETIEEQSSRIQELEDQVSTNRDEFKKDLIKEKENRAKSIKDLHKKIEQIKENDLTEKIDTNNMSKIQKLSTLNEKELKDTSNPTTKRAVEIYKNFQEWSQKTMKGLVLGTQTDNLRKLLEAKLDEKLHPQQVHRAMEKLGELSNKIKYRDNNRKGKLLILENPQNKKHATNTGVS